VLGAQLLIVTGRSVETGPALLLTPQLRYLQPTEDHSSFEMSRSTQLLGEHIGQCMDTLTTCNPDPRNAKPTALPRAATAYVVLASDSKTLAYSALPNAPLTLGATQNNHSCPRAVANW
jgi:hypothetical protein